ncbi:MAG TPA: TonB-dependent receptor [Blastocatellia bacterium]|nr:TonB-dependent receptor [Blastocatellia bacterium]
MMNQLSRNLIKAICVLLCPVTFATAASAQSSSETGQITGRVTDKRGDAINSARVAAVANNQTRGEAKTDRAGQFTLSLPPGDYELRVSADGFSVFSQRVSLKAQPATLNVALEPATVAETVTVTPARTELRLAVAPASVSVIDAKDVSNAAAQTFDDLLRQIPGFSIFRRSSSIVANPTTQGVSLRGAGASGASRTLVLSDGVPLNDAFGGWVYWDRVPRAAVDRVELVRGGSSDLYGTDALSGVINVISRPPTQRVINAEAGYGNRDTADVTFFAGDRWKSFSASVAGEAFRTDGYFLIAPEIRGTADDRAASKHRALTLRLENDWSPTNAIFVRGSLFDEDRDNGTNLQVNDTATESLATGGRFRTPDGSDWNLTLFANQQRYHQTFSAVAANRNSEALNRLQFVPSRDVGVSFNWSRMSFEKHLLVAGVDVRGVSGVSDETAIANNRATTFVSVGGRQRRSGFFIQDLFNISARWQLSVNARYDNWRDSSASSVSRNLTTGAVTPRFFPARSQDAFSPRLSLIFRPTEQISLRASAYRAFRAPTLNELYRGFRVGDTQTNANEKLVAERLTGGETSMNWTPSNRISARLTGYWTEIINPVSNFTLTVTPTLITRERRNLGRTRSRGVEAEADFNVSTYWRISAGYLFADATVRRAPQDARLEGLLIPQVPRNQFTLQTVYSNPRHVTAAMQFRASGKQFDDDQNRLPLGSFAVIDVMVARPLTRHIEAFVAAQNLLNERFVVARTPIENLGMPRMVRGGLRFRFER